MLTRFARIHMGMSPCYFPGRCELQLPVLLFGQMWDSSETEAMLLWLVQSPGFCTPEHIYTQANCSYVLFFFREGSHHVTCRTERKKINKNHNFLKKTPNQCWLAAWKEIWFYAVRNLTTAIDRQRKSYCCCRLFCWVFKFASWQHYS